MNEYYYLKDDSQKGPFTLEELKQEDINLETYVWSAEMSDWTKLKEIPSLAEQIKHKKLPPPPPRKEENISKTEISGKIIISNEKKVNNLTEKINKSRSVFNWIVFWCIFHLFALLMSYSQVEIFNDGGSPDTSSFWPFVEFTYSEYQIDPEKRDLYYERIKTSEFVGDLTIEKTYFNGLFYEYDWSEFLVYIGSAIIFFFIKFKPNE